MSAVDRPAPTPDGTAVVWFRRDLRVRDQPTFLAAADGAARRALALFVLDPALLDPSGAARRTVLYRCLRALDESLGGRLLVVRGDPADVVPRDRGRRRRARRCTSPPTSGPTARPATRPSRRRWPSDGRELVRTGSPYAVAPGRVTKPDGTPYKVFTPFRRAWQQHGWRAPADTDAGTVDWLDPGDKDGGPRRVTDPRRRAASTPSCPPPGEDAALRALAGVPRRRRDAATSARRNRPDKPGTSRMSVHLKYGDGAPAHAAGRPRRRAPETAPTTLRTELAWREFYADVLCHRPDSARENYDRPFDAPALGHRHGGRRALRGLGARAAPASRSSTPGCASCATKAWMHNRVRMIVASFLVKDLHLHWTRGARHFMRYLADGDLASNQHGWQWMAGTGTDAAPFFRVFNPVVQGEKFDPDGDYVRALRAGAARRARQGGAPAVGAAGRAAERLPAPDRGPRRGAPRRRWTGTSRSGPFGLTADGPVGAVPYPFGATGRCCMTEKHDPAPAAHAAGAAAGGRGGRLGRPVPARRASRRCDDGWQPLPPRPVARPDRRPAGAAGRRRPLRSDEPRREPRARRRGARGVRAGRRAGVRAAARPRPRPGRARRHRRRVRHRRPRCPTRRSAPAPVRGARPTARRRTPTTSSRARPRRGCSTPRAAPTTRAPAPTSGSAPPDDARAAGFTARAARAARTGRPAYAVSSGTVSP